MNKRVPYLAGNTRGRDHIPWRMFNGSSPTRRYSQTIFNGVDDVLGDDDNTTILPSAFDLDRIMRLAWRVREWKLTGALTFDFGRTGGDPFTDTFNFVLLDEDTPPFVIRPYHKLVGDLPNALVNDHAVESTNEVQLIDMPRQRQFTAADLSIEVVPPTFDPEPDPQDLYAAYGHYGSWPFNSDTPIDGPVSRIYQTPADILKDFTGTVGIGYEYPSPTMFLDSGDVLEAPGAHKSLTTVNGGLFVWSPGPLDLGVAPQDQVLFNTGTKEFTPGFFLSINAAVECANGSLLVRVGTMFKTSQDVSLVTQATIFDHNDIGALVLDGVTIPIYLSAQFLHVRVVQGFVEFAENFAADFTLAPSKFWPFKNSVGDPIYDEDTGEQLNDPLS